jgi:hypothetical protein
MSANIIDFQARLEGRADAYAASAAAATAAASMALRYSERGA